MPQSYFEQAVLAVSFIWFNQVLEYNSNAYSTYNAKDDKFKILAVEVFTHLQDPSELGKKIDHLHQQSAILLLQGQTLGLRQIGKSRFRF